MLIGPLSSSRPLYVARPAPAASPEATDVVELTRMVLNGADLKVKPVWSHRLGGSISNGDFGPGMSLDGQHLYAGSFERFQQMRQSDGQVQWGYELPNREKFQASPTVQAGAQGELICLGFYQQRDREVAVQGGVVALEASTGKLRFKTSGAIPVELQADAAGNLIYSTQKGDLVRVDPAGNSQVLLHSGEFRLPFLVEPDGAVLAADGATVHRRDGLLESTENLPGPVMDIRPGGLCETFQPDRSRKLCKLNAEGRLQWTADMPDRSRWQPCPDGGAVIAEPGVLRRVGPDGSPGWSLPLEATHWQSAVLQVLPNGDTLLYSVDRQGALCLDPEGRERWSRPGAPAPSMLSFFDHDRLSLTPDNRLLILGRAGLERVDLATGRPDWHYDPERGSLKRWDPEGNLVIDRAIARHGPRPRCLALQGNPDRIYAYDSNNFGLMALAPPEEGEQAADVVRQAGARQVGGQVQERQSYVNVGGVMVPRRRAHTR